MNGKNGARYLIKLNEVFGYYIAFLDTYDSSHGLKQFYVFGPDLWMEFLFI